MSNVFKTVKNTGKLALAAYGGWVAGYKMGRAEALGEDSESIVRQITGTCAGLAVCPDGWRKRVLTPYLQGQLAVVVQKLVEQESS